VGEHVQGHLGVPGQTVARCVGDGAGDGAPGGDYLARKLRLTTNGPPLS
jgi:hypothetical protein